jgi:transcriptional regulator with XRE-family HTH domain
VPTKGFHDPRYRALIDILVAERKRLGLSQQTLAEKVGLPQQIVSRYEIGDRRLDIIEFADIAAALGLSASQMLLDAEI